MVSAPYSLAIIVLAGIAAQWLAWRIRIPSIMLLLVAGFLAGFYIDPDALFGDAMMPIVSFSVAIILFEGGLELRLRELRVMGHTIFALISIGILITWALASFFAHLLLEFDWSAALILGSILVVTGPTVVGPLLRAIRPRGQAAAILKWEGILNDAVGAVLAVLVFEAALAGNLTTRPSHILLDVAATLGVGALSGAAGAWALTQTLRRRWAPDHLDVPVTIGFVIAVFVFANSLQHEAGLLAVTLLGVVLANQRYIDVRHIVEFKENLRVLLLSILFVLLAARLDAAAFLELGWPSVAFVLALIFIVRPVCVFACAIKSGLPMRDRVFMAFLAPRGIVAAAIASVFGLRMAAAGVPHADKLTPTVFLVITGTVIFHGLTAPWLARRLGLASATRDGVVIVGAEPMCRAIAHELSKSGIKTLLIDVNRHHVTQARLEGLDARYGDALSMRLVEELDLSGMGVLLALTPNEHVNSLAALHFSDVFGRHGVYQLAQTKEKGPGLDEDSLPAYLRGNTIAGPEWHHDALRGLFREGAALKTTSLTKNFPFAAYQERYAGRALILFRITETGGLQVCNDQTGLKPLPGDQVMSIIPKDLLEETAPAPAG